MGNFLFAALFRKPLREQDCGQAYVRGRPRPSGLGGDPLNPVHHSREGRILVSFARLRCGTFRSRDFFEPSGLSTGFVCTGRRSCVIVIWLCRVRSVIGKRGIWCRLVFWQMAVRFSGAFLTVRCSLRTWNRLNRRFFLLGFRRA